MTNKKKELSELRKQNKKLKDLVNLYNSGVARIVMCEKCHIPLQSHEDRIRIIYSKRGKDYQYSDRQLRVYHIKCFKIKK